MKNLLTFLLLFGVSLMSLTACNGSKSTTTTTPTTAGNKSDMTIKLDQGPCYGTCPVYKLTITPDGMATYEGLRFTEKAGTFTKQLSASTLQEVHTLVAATDFWQLKEYYNSPEIADAPTYTVTISEGGRNKEVGFVYGYPTSVELLLKKLQTIAESENWTQTSTPDWGLPEGYIAHEFILDLATDVKIDAIEIQFSKQGMKRKHQIDAATNTWLVSWQPGGMTPQEMIKELQRYKGIEAAEFNKEVDHR